MKSRERSFSIKRDSYTCQECGRKQSKKKGEEFKVCVHHLEEIDWKDLVDLVYERLLQTPKDLQTLCYTCHEKETRDT